MSAVVSSVGNVLSTASAGWDPIGNWVVTSDVENANKILKPIEEISYQLDPLGAPIVHGAEQLAGDAIANDPVLNWSAEAIHDLGMAGDGMLQDIGLNPDMVKMAIVGVFAPYAVPLLQAALVKARGGSWEDAILSGVTSYVAQYVGANVGNYVNDYTQSLFAGAPTTAAGVAAEYGIGATSQQAAQIAAQNASLLGAGELAVSGILGRVTAAGAGSATGQLLSTGTVDLDKALSAMTSAGLTAGVPILTSQIPGFSSLPTEVQTSINKAVAGTLQGKDLNAVAATMAMDTAMQGVQNYYKDVMGGLTNTYNSALESFTGVSKEAEPYILAAQDTYTDLNNLKTGYDSKVGEYNALVAEYNATGDAAIKTQLDTLKTEITAIQDQYMAGGETYKTQLQALSPYQQQLDASMNTILDTRDSYFNNAALSINPSADWSAFIASDPTVQQEIDSTGKTAAQIYMERLQSNPTGDQATTWTEAIQNANPDQLINIGQAYKEATGFDLNSTNTGGINPTEFSLYQERVAGSIPQILSEAEAAKQAGDFTKYSSLMNQANQVYSEAYGQSLGSGSGSLSSNYVNNVLNVVANSNLAQQALGSSYKPPVIPPAVAPSGKTITNYGFGGLNPLLSDLMTTNEGANKWLRDTYTYDPALVEARLKGLNVMDFSTDPNQLSTFQSALPGTAAAGNRLFLPANVQQNLQTEFTNLGNTSYNTTNSLSALDYLKSGAPGGLGSYFEAYSNPYTLNPSSGSIGGLNQIASNWAANSGVTSPVAQNQLLNTLTA